MRQRGAGGTKRPLPEAGGPAKRSGQRRRRLRCQTDRTKRCRCRRAVRPARRFVSGAAVLSFAGIIMCWRFPSIFVLHILVLYTGIMLGASMPIFLSAPVLLEGLGTKYAGSAAGVISTLQLLGAVLIPTYILTPIAGDNYSLLFMLASICMVIMFLCGLLLPQFGNNQK